MLIAQYEGFSFLCKRVQVIERLYTLSQKRPTIPTNMQSPAEAPHESSEYAERMHSWMRLIGTIDEHISHLQVAIGQGVSTVVVHPSRRWFAVCEKGLDPSVLIYTYPSLQLYKVRSRRQGPQI